MTRQSISIIGSLLFVMGLLLAGVVGSEQTPREISWWKHHGHGHHGHDGHRHRGSSHHHPRARHHHRGHSLLSTARTVVASSDPSSHAWRAREDLYEAAEGAGLDQPDEAESSPAEQPTTTEVFSKDLGEDLVRLQDKESSAQAQEQELADEHYSLQEKNSNLLHRFKHLEQENRMLKHEENLEGQHLNQVKDTMDGKMKKAYKRFVSNTKILTDEIDRYRNAIQDAGVEKSQMQENLKGLHAQLATAEMNIEFQEKTKKFTDLKHRNSSVAWRHLVRSMTDSLDADETKIAALQAQHRSDSKIIDSRVKEISSLRKSSGEIQSGLEKDLAKATEEAKKAENTIAENSAREKLEKAKEDKEKAGEEKEDAALKTEKERLTKLLAQEKKDQSAETAQLKAHFQQRAEEAQAEMVNMDGAFKNASKTIGKIEAIHRKLVKKLNTSRTELRSEKAALALAENQTANLTDQVKSMEANNTALTLEVKQLRLKLSEEAERHHQREQEINAAEEAKGKRAAMEDQLERQVEEDRTPGKKTGNLAALATKSMPWTKDLLVRPLPPKKRLGRKK